MSDKKSLQETSEELLAGLLDELPLEVEKRLADDFRKFQNRSATPLTEPRRPDEPREA